MSEPNGVPEPRKEGGLKQPPAPQPSDTGVNKTGGDDVRKVRDAADVELDDSPGGRSGGMIDEG